MSKTTTFEAWAVQRDTGTLIAYDPPGAGPLLLMNGDSAERDALIGAAYGVGFAPVRVRVTVETIEEGEA